MLLVARLGAWWTPPPGHGPLWKEISYTFEVQWSLFLGEWPGSGVLGKVMPAQCQVCSMSLMLVRIKKHLLGVATLKEKEVKYKKGEFFFSNFRISFKRSGSLFTK